MTEAGGYLMESQLEAERLEAKTDEEESLRHLALVGVREGMHVLDAGAGTGAVARTIARIVGPTGSVVALELSPERVAAGERAAQGLERLRFVIGDVYDPPLAPDQFDLVWCRFLFEYLEDPLAALRELVARTRPGGKVVLGDLDGNGLFHFPLPPHLEAGLATLQRAIAGRFDPFVGRKLFHYARRAGLERLKVHLLPYHLYAGTAPAAHVENWATKFRILAPVGVRAFGGQAAYVEFCRQFLALLEDPDAFTYSVLVFVEGTRSGSVDGSGRGDGDTRE